jgi:DNA-binding IclR family transcriptional regulator
VRDEWLRQVPGDTRAHYAEALVATHDRGFAVEIGSTPVARVRELVTLLGDDASARGVLDRLADELATHAEFLALQLDPDREYAVNVVNAPVFDHTGQVTLVLSLTGFGRPLRGAEALAVGDRLVDATRTLTTALGGAAPAPTRTSVT